MEKELDINIVRGVADNYNLDKEELVRFLADLGELYDLEEFIEVAELLDS